MGWEGPRAARTPRRLAAPAVALLGVGLAIGITVDLTSDGEDLPVDSGPEGETGAVTAHDEQAPEGPAGVGRDDRGDDPAGQLRDGSTVAPAARLPDGQALTLYALTEAQAEVLVADLATGAITSRELETVWTTAPTPPAATEHGLVVPARTRDPLPMIYLYPEGMEGDAVALDYAEYFIGADEHHVWLANRHYQGSDTRLLRVAPDGTGTASTYDVPASAWPLGATAEGLVIAIHGTIVLHDLEGDGSVLARGQALAMAGQYVAWTHCDAGLQCRVSSRHIEDEGSTREASLGDPAEARPWSGSASLSPDGRHLAVDRDTTGRSSAIDVIDLEAGERVEVAGASNRQNRPVDSLAVWSPDGQWLFAPGTEGGVVAWHAEAREAHVLPVTDRIPSALMVH